MTIYTDQEVTKASREYFNNDELATKVFIDKYALRNREGELLEKTPTDMHHRIAKELARVESGKFKNPLSEQEIFDYLDHFRKIVPQGSPMFGIGNPYQYTSLANCFLVESPEDSYGGILKTDEQLVQICKRRGGVGVDISKLRPVDSRTSNASGSSTGIVPFMERYSNSIREVGQCLVFNSLVLTKNGLKEIQYIQPNKDYVWTLNGWIKVVNKIKCGIKDVWKVTTKKGLTCTASADHIFLSSNRQETRLKNLNKKDQIVCIPGTLFNKPYLLLKYINYTTINNSRFNDITLPKALDEDLAYFLGYSYGDGHIVYKNKTPQSLCLSVNNSKMIEKLEQITYNKFNYDITNKSGSGNVRVLSIHSVKLCKWLKQNSLLKEKTGSIIVPQNILDSTSSVQLAFFAGYFDADGCAHKTGKNIRVTSISQNFIYKMQTILLSIGIISNIQIRKPPKLNERTEYRLNIAGTYSQELLRKYVPSIKIHNMTRVSKQDNNLTPYNCSDLAINNIRKNYSFIPCKNQNISISALNKIKNDNYFDQELSFIDTITDISNEGKQECYDLCLESEHLFWCNGFYVHNSGRRGALLISLNVHHPEILNFITAKKNTTKITGANLSIKLTDEFLNAVEKNVEYQQRWPVDSDTPQIQQMVKAKDIWDAIIENVHLSSEPGLLFWDTITRNTPSDCYEQYKSEGTNPCQPGWAKILTPDGIRTMDDINIGDKIWSLEGWSTVVKKRSSGIQDVYRYGTTAGCFYGTAQHKVLDNDKIVEVQYAKTLDTSSYFTWEKLEVINPQDIMDGLVLGDGSKHKVSNDRIYLCIGQNDQDYFNSEIKQYIGQHRPAFGETAYEITTTITPQELDYTYNRHVPNRYLYSTPSQMCGFLKGLFSANGGICGQRVTLKASSFEMIEDVQLMLSALGIRSYYTTNKGKKVLFKNGTYKYKKSYDINICADRQKFLDLIGFIQKYKIDKLIHLTKTIQKSCKPAKNAYDIISTEYVNTEEVFDITVDNTSHTYFTQGVNVKNCGEIILDPLNACRLLLLNLYSYVNNPFTKQSSFNFDSFYQDCKIAQRFQDDIIDLELEAVDRIIQKITDDPEPISVKDRELRLWKTVRNKTKTSRRTGTGITALGDTIAALGVKYGSKKSIEITEQIYKTLKLACYESSVDMAEELGPFEGWDYKLEKNHPFLSQIKEENSQLYARMKKYGRRNIALLTTAPAGSVSILCQTTSGIEPVYQLKYKRRKKYTPNDKNFRTDFVDKTGDKWMEFDVDHGKLKQWMDVTGETDISKAPWVCATDINWKNRIEIQAVAQKHNCHSIAFSINLQNSVTLDEINKIYFEAWKAGLKGITIYRQGSRDGVLIQATPDKEKRPKELYCDVHHTVVKGQKYFVLVGLWSDGNPYEIFTGKNGFLPNSIKSGRIIKKRKNFYKVEFDDKDETELSPITATMSETEETLSRMISLSLRSNANIHLIVQQLEKIGENDMHNFAKGVARVLKNYIPDNTQEGEKCPECKGDLIRIGGCPNCTHCGWSRCV